MSLAFHRCLLCLIFLHFSSCSTHQPKIVKSRDMDICLHMTHTYVCAYNSTCIHAYIHPYSPQICSRTDACMIDVDNGHICAETRVFDCVYVRICTYIYTFVHILYIFNVCIYKCRGRWTDRWMGVSSLANPARGHAGCPAS